MAQYYCASLSQGQLDDTLGLQHIRPDLLNLQPRRTNQLMPPFLRTLGRCATGYQSYINLGRDDATSVVRENQLAENDLGIVRRHCCREL